MTTRTAPMTLPTYRKLTAIKQLGRAAFKQALSELTDTELDQFMFQPTPGLMALPTHYTDLDAEASKREHS